MSIFKRGTAHVITDHGRPLIAHLSVRVGGELSTAGRAVLDTDQHVEDFDGQAVIVDGAPRWRFTLPVGTHEAWGAWVLITGIDGYEPCRARVIVKPNLFTPDGGEVCPVAVPTAIPRRPASQFMTGRAAFCCTRDSQGLAVFTPFIATCSPEKKAEWYAIMRRKLACFLPIAPECAYPTLHNNTAYPRPFNWLMHPDLVAAHVREVLATPAHDGYAITPMLFMDGGGRGIRERIDAFWGPVRDAVGDDANDLMVTPGWELVTAGECTSAEYEYALLALQRQGWPHIWSHLSQGRAAWSSNPIEPDDPLQGDEAGCWRGKYAFIEGLLFQSVSTRPDDDRLPMPRPGDTTAQGWWDRWNDVLPRMGNGLNGWRRMGLWAFESPEYYFAQGKSDEAFCDRMDEQHTALAHAYGVTIGHGYGQG